MNHPYREPHAPECPVDPLVEAKARILREIASSIRSFTARAESDDALFTSHDFARCIGALRELHDAVMCVTDEGNT